MENFLDELNENEILRDDFLAQTSIAGAYEIAKPYLDEGVTEEDFNSEMVNLAKNIVNNDELDETALENVQGGCEDPQIALLTIQERLEKGRI